MRFRAVGVPAKTLQKTAVSWRGNLGIYSVLTCRFNRGIWNKPSLAGKWPAHPHLVAKTVARDICYPFLLDCSRGNLSPQPAQYAYQAGITHRRARPHRVSTRTSREYRRCRAGTFVLAHWAGHSGRRAARGRPGHLRQPSY